MKKTTKILIRQIRNSIILVSIIWYICSQVIFINNPGFFAKSRVSEDITWEIKPIPYINYTFVIFNIKYDIWLNNPLPLITLHNHGCHEMGRGTAVLENKSIMGVEVSSFVCILMGVPGIDLPGRWIDNLDVDVSFENSKITELPNGLYTFWVDFDLHGNNIVSYKTYLNATDGGVEIYSDEVPLFWGEVMSSTGIMVVCIIIVTSLQKLKSKNEKVKITQ